MATLVLNIPDSEDIALLAPLLRRLGITMHIPEAPIHATVNLEALDQYFDALNAHHTFESISDVVEWQRSLRNEWD